MGVAADEWVGGQRGGRVVGPVRGLLLWGRRVLCVGSPRLYSKDTQKQKDGEKKKDAGLVTCI